MSVSDHLKGRGIDRLVLATSQIGQHMIDESFDSDCGRVVAKVVQHDVGHAGEQTL